MDYGVGRDTCVTNSRFLMVKVKRSGTGTGIPKKPKVLDHSKNFLSKIKNTTQFNENWQDWELNWTLSEWHKEIMKVRNESDGSILLIASSTRVYHRHNILQRENNCRPKQDQECDTR